MVEAKDAATYELVYPNRVLVKDTSGESAEYPFFKASRNYQLYYSGDHQVQLYYNNAFYNLKEELLYRMPQAQYAKRKFLGVIELGGNNFLCCMNGLLVNGSVWLLKGRQVSCITQDMSGNYWISTLKHGVYKMSRDFTTLREFSNVYNGPLVFAEALPNYLFFISYLDNSLNWVQTNKPEPTSGAAGIGDKPRRMEDLKGDLFFFSYNQNTPVITTWTLKNGYLSYFNLESRDVWVKNVFPDGEFYNVVNYNGVFRVRYNAHKAWKSFGETDPDEQGRS